MKAAPLALKHRCPLLVVAVLRRVIGLELLTDYLVMSQQCPITPGEILPHRQIVYRELAFAATGRCRLKFPQICQRLFHPLGSGDRRSDVVTIELLDIVHFVLKLPVVVPEDQIGQSLYAKAGIVHR